MSQPAGSQRTKGSSLGLKVAAVNVTTVSQRKTTNESNTFKKREAETDGLTVLTLCA